jgi:hypothetical protein
MSHKFSGRKGKWLKTTNIKGEELDIYKLPDGRVVGYIGGTEIPSRIWQNMKDFKFAEKVFIWL